MKKLYLKFTNDEKIDEDVITLFALLNLEGNIKVLRPQNDSEELFLIFKTINEDDLGKGYIALHKKNKTDTYFTINSLNKLLEVEYNQKPGFRIPEEDWENYKNMVLLVKDGNLNKIPFKYE